VFATNIAPSVLANIKKSRNAIISRLIERGVMNDEMLSNVSGVTSDFDTYLISFKGYAEGMCEAIGMQLREFMIVHMMMETNGHA